MQSLTFLTEGPCVVLLVSGRRALSAPWRVCDDLLSAITLAMQAHAAGKPATYRQRIDGAMFEIHTEFDKLLLLAGPVRLFEANLAPCDGGPSIARQIVNAWRYATRKAEENEAAERIAMDAAILHRSGAPFGLSSLPAIREEARKLADGDRDLRRFMRDERNVALPLPAPTVRGNVTPFERAATLITRIPSPEKFDSLH